MDYEQAAKELACALLFRVVWVNEEYWNSANQVAIPSVYETEDLRIAMQVLGLPNPCPEGTFSPAIGAY